MNASCIICHELYTQRSEIYSTSCGHLFHQQCLLQWVESAKTCPQCRHAESSKTVHRIYLNFPSSEGILDDLVALQANLDVALFEVSTKDRAFQKYSMKYRKCQSKCGRLKERIVVMDADSRVHETNMLELRGHLTSYQNKSLERDKHVQEIETIKNNLNSMQPYKAIYDSSQEQIEVMKRLNRTPEALGLIITTHKKQLVQIAEETHSMTAKITNGSKDIFKINARIDKTNAENAKLKQSLQSHDANCAAEIKYLHSKIQKIKGKNTVDGSAFNDSTLGGLLTPNSNSIDVIVLDDVEFSTTPARSSRLRAPRVRSMEEFATSTSTATSESRTEAQRQTESHSIDSNQRRTSTGTMKRTKSTSSYTSSKKFKKLDSGQFKK